MWWRKDREPEPQHDYSAEAARIAMAVAALDHHMRIQSEMYGEDRNDELCDALLELREILAPSVVSAAS